MPLITIFSNATIDQTILLNSLLIPPAILPLQQLIGIYISGTLDTGSVLTQVQNPADNSWITVEDLSWRNAYPDGSGEAPLPPGGTDGSTYYALIWAFRFVITGASGSTLINLAMNW